MRFDASLLELGNDVGFPLSCLDVDEVQAFMFLVHDEEFGSVEQQCECVLHDRCLVDIKYKAEFMIKHISFLGMHV